MNARRMATICIIFLAVILLVFGARAQAPDQEQEPGAAQAPEKQAPEQKAKPKPKQIDKIFCAESSVAQRFLMVQAINCQDVCADTYKDYECNLQQRVSEGWRVTSVTIGTIIVERNPCECRVTGTESIIEKE